MTNLRLLAGMIISLSLSAGPGMAQKPLEQFVCTGTFSSGSGMAGSSIEKNGTAICLFAADTDAEAQVQNTCGQNAVCEVTAMTRMDGDARIVEKTLSVRRVSGLLPAGPARKVDNGQIPIDSISCPTLDFKAFAEQFSSKISLQAKFTHWPLKTTTIDAAAAPEPKPVTKQLTEQDMSYPVMMEIGRAKREGKIVRIEQDGATTAYVEYSGANSGEKFRYLFVRSGSCWQLVAIDNKSL